MKKISALFLIYLAYYLQAYAKVENTLRQSYVEGFYEDILAQPTKDSATNLLYTGMALLALERLKEAKEKLSEVHLIFEKKKNEEGIWRSKIYLNALKEKEGQSCMSSFDQAADFFSKKKNWLMQAEALYYKGIGCINRSSFKQAKQDLKTAILSFKKANAKQAVLKVQLALGEYYLMRSKWHKARDCFLKVVSESSQHKHLLSFGLRGLGEVDRSAFHTVKANMHFDRALDFARQRKDFFAENLCIQGKADLLFLKGDYPNAINLYKQALEQAHVYHLARVEIRILRNMGEALRMSDHVQEAQKYFTKSLIKARILQDKRAEAWALLGQADVARITDAPELSKKLYITAYPLFEQTECKQGQAQCLRGRGTLLYNLGEYEKARDKLEIAFHLCKEIEDQLTASRVLIWQGKVENALGHYGRARSFYEKGISLCQSIQDPWGEVQLLTYLGDLEREHNHPEEAKLIYKKTIDLAERIGDRAKEAMAHQGMGILCIEDQQNKKAQFHLQKALDIFKTIHHLSGQAHTLYQFGKAEKQPKKAMSFYEKAYVLAEECQDILLKIALWRAMGTLDTTHNKKTEGNHAFEKAYEMSEKIQNKKEQAKVLYDWAEALLKQNHKEDAFEAVKKSERALELFEKLDDTLGQARTWKLLADGYQKQNIIKKSKEADQKYRKIWKFLGFV